MTINSSKAILKQTQISIGYQLCFHSYCHWKQILYES